MRGVLCFEAVAVLSIWPLTNPLLSCAAGAPASAPFEFLRREWACATQVYGLEAVRV